MDTSPSNSSEPIFGRRPAKLYDDLSGDSSKLAGKSERSDDFLSIPTSSYHRRSNKKPNPSSSDDSIETEISEIHRFGSPNNSNYNGDIDSPTASRSSTATFGGGSRTGTPLLDQTISAAFRTRIRSRIRTAKESVKSPSSSSGVASKLLPNELNGNLTSQVDARLKNDWKKTIVNLIDPDCKTDESRIILPTPDESYNFFTRSVDQDSIKSPIKEMSSNRDTMIPIENESKDEDAETVRSDGDDGDSGKLLIKHLFTSADDLNMCQRNETSLRSRKQRISKESKILTYPSTNSLPNHVKYGRDEGFNPHEDGLYLGSPPKSISQRNINKLCNRLYQESGVKWFRNHFKTLFQVLFTFFTQASKMLNHLKTLPSLSSEDDLYITQPVMSKKDFLALDETEKPVKYELLLTLHSLQFESHELFIEENFVVARLIGLYQKYQKISTFDSIAMLSRKIDSLRVSIANMSVSLSSQEPSSIYDDKDAGNDGDDDEMKTRKTRLINYREQLMAAIEARRKALQELRSLLVELLSTREDLEEKRRVQGFTSTNLTLTYSEEVNHMTEDQEREVWNKLIEEDFTLQRFITQQAYEKELEEYRRKLRSWKNWQRNLRRGSKHEKSDLSNGDGGQSDVNDSQTMIKPEPPEKPLDDATLYQNVRSESLLLDGRVPGEPKFTGISLTFDHEVTPSQDCPSFEQKRRSAIKKLRYFVEIKVSGSQRGKTFEQEVDLNFTVNWNQRFKIELYDEPKDIRLNLWEKTQRADLLTPIQLPLPEAVTMPSEDGDDEVHNHQEAEFTLESDKSKCSGKIFYSGSWTLDEKGSLLCPISASLPRREMKLNHLDWKEFQKIREKNLTSLDPNDAENIELFRTIEAYEELLKKNPDLGGSTSVQQGDLLMKSYQFCDPSEIEANPRFRLIRLRSQKREKFKGLAVPLLEREVPLSIFDDENGLEEMTVRSSKGIEAKRAKSMAILNQVRSKLMNQAQGFIDRPRTWEDLVSEPDSQGLKFGFNLLLPSHDRRPLHPSRKERKKISGSLMSNTEVKLIITIMHAFNVPVRIENQAASIGENVPPTGKLNSELNELNYESRISPFVEVVFQRQIERTSTAEGAQPTWNETLSLKLKSPNDDFSPSSLTTITDWVYLNLFDEIPIESDVETSIPQRLERRWLGSLKIPFSTLYLNSKIEGTFKLNTPPVLLGYEYDSRLYKIGQNLSSANTSSPNTYLTLFLTIDPTLQLPEPLSLKCDSNEPEKLLIHGKKWETECRSDFPDREIRAFAIDLDAKFVLVSRYIRPIKPPESLLQSISMTDDAMYRLARFVSLIPSMPDNIALPGLGDIWCSCDQFLDMMVGDEEEHAILLCNFFLYLGKRAGVILGFGIPEGLTAYVIVWEYTGEEPSVWNPISGEKFNIRDSYIPLNAIGTIFTSENVYANIQKHVHPNRLIYDVTKSSCWKPLFNRKFPNPGFPSIQPELIEFEPIDEEHIGQLQSNLEKHLRESLMRWRKKSRTFFNRSAIQQIRKILPRLEKKLGRLQQNDLVQELQDILTVHKMIGFPLNMPYTSMKAVTEAVYATGLHLIEDRKVDFALAVYLHPYPCNLLSVWVYIAALLKDK